jgi:transcriptional antiterminator RfaH
MTTMSYVLSEAPSWYALATKPRQEDRAERNLAAWGICTLAPRLRNRAGERRQLLFPGYVFARFNWEAMATKIRFTHGVSYIVSFGGRPAQVADEIIRAVRERVGEDGSVRVGTTFQAGDPLLIVSGPLRDFSGVFEQELSGGERVRILLTTITSTRRLEVSKYDLMKQRGQSHRRVSPENPNVI